MFLQAAVVFNFLAHVSQAVAISEPAISLLSPQGIRFQINHVAGASLVSFHYNVNNVLPQTTPGIWNFNISSPSDTVWVHENRNVQLNPGDVVHFWIYMVIDGRGYQITDRRWTVPPIPVNVPANNGDLPGLRLVFEDHFDSLNTSEWEFDVSLWGGGNWEFQAYTDLPETCFVRDGKLFIKPMLTADKYGEDFLSTGVWDVRKTYGRCTNDAFFGCIRDGAQGLLNPVLSARINTKVAIKYGKVEIIAKMPRGDWLWPALWMLPKDWKYGGWPRSGEIDICEARGNRKFGDIGVEYMGSALHWGPDFANNRYQMTLGSRKVRSQTLADGMHSYVLDWDESGMDFYLDGDLIVRFPTPSEGWFRWGNFNGDNIWPSPNAPFDERFYLIMNVAVGGMNGYFPDDLANEGYTKPWRNSDTNAPQKFWEAKNRWLPTWQGDDAAMQVDSVKMWQKV